MRRQSLAAVLLLTGVTAALLAALGRTGEDAAQDVPAAQRQPPRVLPGLQSDGFVQLPNQWRLRPVGTQIEVGDLPVNIAVHPDGRYLAVLHAGYGTHEVMVIDVQARSRIVSRAVIDQAFYGLTFSPDGRRLYASGGEYEVVHAFEFRNGQLFDHRQIPIADPKGKYILGGLAVSPDAKTLAAAGTWGNAVTLVPLDAPDQKAVVALDPIGKQLPSERTGPTFRENEGGAPPGRNTADDCFPYACLFEPGGKRLFVSLWNKAAVAAQKAN